MCILFEYDNQLSEIVPENFVSQNFFMHELDVAPENNFPEYPRFYSAYRSAEQGKPFVYIDRWFPSSQLCHVCACKYEGTRDLSVREGGPSCHTPVRRDWNSALTLKMKENP